MKIDRLCWLFGAVFSFFFTHSEAKTWQIGPARPLKYCDAVLPMLADGDTVQIDAATYTDVPQVIFPKNNLLIEGVGGRPKLVAGQKIATDMVNGKGIFVISGKNARVRNIEFDGAAVVDHNGAGIRQEGANLTVQHCRFAGNEMGILSGAIAGCTILVEFSEFVNGGSTANPGYQHNIYIGKIDTFVFRFNASIDAIAEGHELKSRAHVNLLLFNRLANESTTDSRTIDLPNGGTALLLGNIIAQGFQFANNNLVGFDSRPDEQPAAPARRREQHVCQLQEQREFHTSRKRHRLAFCQEQPIRRRKNRRGCSSRNGRIAIDSSNNLVDDIVGNFGFAAPASFDFHLVKTSPARDKGVLLANKVANVALNPAWEYLDTCSRQIRPVDGKPDIGAFEYATPSAVSDVFAEVRIFPNPANDVVFVENGESWRGQTVEIIDAATGVLVKKTVFLGDSIWVGDLAAGFYVIRVGNGVGKWVKL